MAIAAPNTSTTTAAPGTGQNYTAPLATVTTLFFMWGFLTCLNDILVPHLKSIFDLSYAEVMLIQFAFFGAYFVFSIPSAKIIDWMGYQRSMVVGLLTMGLGAFLFVPAASVPSFPLFLGALIVLAAGNHLPTGGSESLCHCAGKARDCFEPTESDTGIQLARDFPGSIFRRAADSDCGE